MKKGCTGICHLHFENNGHTGIMVIFSPRASRSMSLKVVVVVLVVVGTHSKNLKFELIVT